VSCLMIRIAILLTRYTCLFFTAACSCVCHSCFTLHRRYYDEDMLKEILRRVEETGAEPLRYAEFTKARLLSAADRNGAGLAAKRKLLAEYPRNKEQSLHILANGGGGDDYDDDEDASDSSSMSRGDFSDEQGEEGEGRDSDHELEDDRKIAAAVYMQDDDEIAVLNSDAPSTDSSVIMRSLTASTTGSVNDTAVAEKAVVDNNKCCGTLSIPKEIYAAAAAYHVEESCVMEVEEAPRRRRKEYHV
jgi:hypothetical protein